MIDAFERQAAEEMGRYLAELNALAPLFLAPRVFPAIQNLADADGLQDDQAALLLQVTRLVLLPESRQVGMPGAVEAQQWRANARVRILLAGPTNGGEIADDATRRISPPGTGFAGIDHTLAALLPALGERVQAAPDGARHSLGLAGKLTAAAGGRSALLTWRWGEIGAIEQRMLDQRRAWVFTIQAELHYRLSPAAPEGGRILRLDTETAGTSGRIYAGAEALGLADIDGLTAALRTELAGRGIRTLGDMPPPERIGTLLDALDQLDEPGRGLLLQLSTIFAARRRFRPMARTAPLPRPLLALPVGALLTPTPEQQAQLAAAETNLQTKLHIALIARPLAGLLSQEARAGLALGHLLRVQDWSAAEGATDA